MMHVNMIRNKKTGLFSTGGSSPTFSTKGKIWPSSTALNGHLSSLGNSYIAKVYADCEIIAFELVEPSATLDITEMLAREARKTSLKKMHPQGSFMELLDRLYQKDLIKQFPWVVHIDTNWDIAKKLPSDVKEVLKNFKISKTNYRTSDSTFAFANKDDAAKFRLGISAYTTFAYNGITLLKVEDDDNT
jgi:hypothetical protein